MSNIQEELLASILSGDFLDVVFRAYLDDRSDRKALGLLLAELHNQKKLDLISEFQQLNNDEGRRDFWLLRLVLEEVLPLLNAPVTQVMACVKHLTLEAGADMTASMLIEPFVLFCQQDASRPTEVLDEALSDVDETFDFVTAAVLAGSRLNLVDYVNRAILLLQHEQEIVVRRVVWALGRIDYQRQQELSRQAFEAILQSLSVYTLDEFNACVLRALNTLQLQNSVLEPDFLAYVSNLKTSAGDYVVHAASEALFYDQDKISSFVEEALWNIATLVKPTMLGTIRNLDYSLKRIIERGDPHKAMVFLEKTLLGMGSSGSIGLFDGTSRELLKHKNRYLSILITRWFLSGSVAYGRYGYELLKSMHEPIDLAYDLSQLVDDYAEHHAFLVRKACGWLFIKPRIAMSLIMSLIDSCPEQQLAEIAKTTFNPLLISYSGGLKEYLVNVQDREGLSERLRTFVADLLARLEAYHAELKLAVQVKELKPSEAHRFVFDRYQQKMMQKHHEDAKEKSILLHLVSESVLLYGNKSIHYVHHGEQKSRQEMPLHGFSHSIEFPALSYYSPHQLENILFGYKVEGCAS